MEHNQLRDRKPFVPQDGKFDTQTGHIAATLQYANERWDSAIPIGISAADALGYSRWLVQIHDCSRHEERGGRPMFTRPMKLVAMPPLPMMSAMPSHAASPGCSCHQSMPMSVVKTICA